MKKLYSGLFAVVAIGSLFVAVPALAQYASPSASPLNFLAATLTSIQEALFKLRAELNAIQTAVNTGATPVANPTTPTVAVESVPASGPAQVTLSLSPSSPPGGTVAPGTLGMFALIQLKTGSSPVAGLNGIQIASDSPNADTILGDLSLSDENGALGTLVPSLSYNGSYYYGWTFPLPPVPIPANYTKLIKVSAKVFSNALPGSSFRLGIAGLNFVAPGAYVSGAPVYGKKFEVIVGTPTPPPPPTGLVPLAPFSLFAVAFPLQTVFGPSGVGFPEKAHRVLLEWIDASGYAGGGDEAGFKIQRSTDGINFVTIGDTIPANTNAYPYVFFLDAPQTGGNYWYRVGAFNAYGGSTYTTSLGVVVP